MIFSFFDSIDTNKDSKISPLELKDFIIHQSKDPHIHDKADDLVETIMELLDADANGSIEKHEFKSRATRWLEVIKQYVKHLRPENDVRKFHAPQGYLFVDNYLYCEN